MIGVCPRPVNNQTDYYAVDLHIAKNAREEKLNARKQAQMTPEKSVSTGRWSDSTGSRS
jgi:hypothetical protein